MRTVSFAVVCGDFDFEIRGALDHVLIGHNVARRIDYESRAEALQRLAHLARPASVVAKKLRVKIFNRIAHRATNYSLAIDVDHRRQNLRPSQTSGLRRGIRLRKARCRSYLGKRAQCDHCRPNFSTNSHLCRANNEAASALST